MGVKRASSVSNLLSSIRVSPVTRHVRSAAGFRQPVEVGCFSYDGQRALRPQSTAALKFFHAPKLDKRGNDLSSGFEDRYIARASAIDNLDSLLACLNIDDHVRNDGRPRLVTWRGILTKLCVAPYSTDTWALRATLHNGSCLLWRIRRLLGRLRLSMNHIEETHDLLGLQVRGLATLDHDPALLSEDELTRQERDRVENGVVDTHIQYCSIVKTRIGQMDVFIGAEVDCVMDESSTAPSSSSAVPPPSSTSTSNNNSTTSQKKQYAELKTHRTLTNTHQTLAFHRQKLLKTYFQCFLAGIPRIVVGFRDDNGFIEKVQVFKTLEVPRMVREYAASAPASNNNGNRYWEKSGRDDRRGRDYGRGGRQDGGRDGRDTERDGNQHNAQQQQETWDPAVGLNFAEEVLNTIWKTISKENALLPEAENSATSTMHPVSPRTQEMRSWIQRGLVSEVLEAKETCEYSTEVVVVTVPHENCSVEVAVDGSDASDELCFVRRRRNTPVIDVLQQALSTSMLEYEARNWI
ncbi:RAI1-domain-containing protein [Rhizoclosmatium globosum]|uniref:Decapping nuclease n=1 Tax=Rhizoclosmatium globosum TaxID=329046 RepID=A0A1Y2CS70_9FUNG|nr:RAI1-domain-containing protein [Rhizoclosmatium globosum]|eukprot:ORY49817.1 RAI1-domain-containing protein [Rhizoclosmatium globosum]